MVRLYTPARRRMDGAWRVSALDLLLLARGKGAVFAGRVWCAWECVMGCRRGLYATLRGQQDPFDTYVFEASYSIVLYRAGPCGRHIQAVSIAAGGPVSAGASAILQVKSALG